LEAAQWRSKRAIGAKLRPPRIESRAPGQARPSPERISGQNGPIPMILLIGARGKICTMKAKSRSAVKRAMPPARAKRVVGSGRLKAGEAKIEARSSLVGLTIYPPAEPPRKIPKSAFHAFD
jgi:hypothetical protein